MYESAGGHAAAIDSPTTSSSCVLPAFPCDSERPLQDNHFITCHFITCFLCNTSLFLQTDTINNSMSRNFILPVTFWLVVLLVVAACEVDGPSALEVAAEATRAWTDTSLTFDVDARGSWSGMSSKKEQKSLLQFKVHRYFLDNNCAIVVLTYSEATGSHRRVHRRRMTASSLRRASGV